MLMMFITCLFTSCLSLNQCPVVTSATVTSNNYRVLREVEGRTTQVAVLGIGGASRKLQERNAVDVMYANAKLKPGQAIINVNVNCTQSIYVFGLVMTIKTIARGTVIEFTDEASQSIVETSQTNTSKKFQTIDFKPDSVILAEVQQAPNKYIGDPELLRSFNTAQLKVTGKDAEPSHYDQFRKQFNYRIVHYGSFSLKESAQPLVAHLIITNVEDEYVTAVIRFTTKDGHDIVAFDLGTGTIKSLAHTLADRMQNIVD